jgi:hypothetical protein
VSKFINIAGNKYGKLTAISYQGNDKHGKAVWLCRCECGNEKFFVGCDLRSNKIASCGCLQKELASEYCRKNKSKHKMCDTRIYSIWVHLKERCISKKSDNFKNYGGRGITICDKWLDFEGFYEDMGRSYEEHIKIFGENNTSIDRIDNNKSYMKDNCKWSTLIEQSNNKRNNKHILYNGETMTLAEASRKFKINYDALLKRLKKGWSAEKALLTPIRKKV